MKLFGIDCSNGSDELDKAKVIPREVALNVAQAISDSQDYCAAAMSVENMAKLIELAMRDAQDLDPPVEPRTNEAPIVS